MDPGERKSLGTINICIDDYPLSLECYRRAKARGVLYLLVKVGFFGELVGFYVARTSHLMKSCGFIVVGVVIEDMYGVELNKLYILLLLNI